MKQFIRINRGLIDYWISETRAEHDPPGYRRKYPRMNDGDRRRWILNSSTLYRIALAFGVENI